MLASLPFILLISTILGFLSGIGIGGGSLLILWLTLIENVPQNTARMINLLFFFPSACIACLFRWKQGNLNWKTILPAIICGCVSAAIFSWFSTKIDLELLKKMFGGLLLFTGLRELLYKAKKPQRQI